MSTTGWIGFGLSPAGQMPGSDIIIGWISDDAVGVISVCIPCILSYNIVVAMFQIVQHYDIALFNILGLICSVQDCSSVR